MAKTVFQGPHLMVAKDMSLQDGDFVGVDTPLCDSLHLRMEVWRGPSAGTGGQVKQGC